MQEQSISMPELQKPAGDAEPPSIMRMAIVGTPRCGNTWLRGLLASAYHASQQAVHDPADVTWDQLSPRAVLQLHWLPTPEFLAQLAGAGFKPISIARHPLDTLLSILHFAQNPICAPTARWLQGRCGDESAIENCLPCSQKFLDYAVSARAAALLEVTCRWWERPDVIRVRYEDLVTDTRTHLARLVTVLGPPMQPDLDAIIDFHRVDRFRGRSATMLHHAWNSQAGSWRQLLPAPQARRIFEAHADVFERLGYSCDPDESLSPDDADGCWYKMELARQRRDVQELWKRVKTAEAPLEEVLQQLDTAAVGLADTQHELERFAGIGPNTLAMVRLVKRWAARMPAAARLIRFLVKKLVRNP